MVFMLNEFEGIFYFEWVHMVTESEKKALNDRWIYIKLI